MEKKDYVELNSFLKAIAVAPTGGQAKNIIRSGLVNVNGEKELRNKRKLREDDRVGISGKEYRVTSNFIFKN
ncbi:MAG: RNA-binding S4 domain-containing protein [Nanoarchaeota archaeon]